MRVVSDVDYCWGIASMRLEYGIEGNREYEWNILDP